MTFDRSCLLIAALVYFTAAWFGVGYYGEDEFQHVILFAEHLRGHVDAASMPLEFHAQWRSMALPVIAASVFGTCEAIGITNPFHLTLILRLLTAALALWVMHGSIRTLQKSLSPDLVQPLVLLSYFLWFVPVLSIRFTGEAWSGLLLLRGLAVLLDEDRPRRFVAAGLWLGAAIIFRPAVVMAPFGVAIWLVLIQRAGWRNVLRLVLAGGIMLLLGVCIDSATYGEPVFTLWNYSLAGLRGDEAWRFTSLPWYHYALFISKYGVLPIGLLLLGAFVALLVLRPKHILVWALVPFLIAHSILPVKEVRFLFPLAPLMPWMLIATWEALQERWPQAMARTIWLRIGFLFAALNLIALTVGVFTPAGNGRIELAEAIHDRYGDGPVHIDHLGDWRQWIPPFFLAPGSTEAFVEKVVIDPKLHGPNHLVIAKRSLDMDRVNVLEPIVVATPAWTDRLLGWYMLEDGHDPLTLYRITSQNSGH